MLKNYLNIEKKVYKKIFQKNKNSMIERDRKSILNIKIFAVCTLTRSILSAVYMKSRESQFNFLRVIYIYIILFQKNVCKMFL